MMPMTPMGTRTCGCGGPLGRVVSSSTAPIVVGEGHDLPHGLGEAPEELVIKRRRSRAAGVSAAAAGDARSRAFAAEQVGVRGVEAGRPAGAGRHPSFSAVRGGRQHERGRAGALRRSRVTSWASLAAMKAGQFHANSAAAQSVKSYLGGLNRRDAEARRRKKPPESEFWPRRGTDKTQKKTRMVWGLKTQNTAPDGSYRVHPAAFSWQENPGIDLPRLCDSAGENSDSGELKRRAPAPTALVLAGGFFITEARRNRPAPEFWPQKRHDETQKKDSDGLGARTQTLLRMAPIVSSCAFRGKKSGDRSPRPLRLCGEKFPVRRIKTPGPAPWPSPADFSSRRHGEIAPPRSFWPRRGTDKTQKKTRMVWGLDPKHCSGSSYRVILCLFAAKNPGIDLRVLCDSAVKNSGSGESKRRARRLGPRRRIFPHGGTEKSPGPRSFGHKEARRDTKQDSDGLGARHPNTAPDDSYRVILCLFPAKNPGIDLRVSATLR